MIGEITAPVGSADFYTKKFQMKYMSRDQYTRLHKEIG
jgi:hypothetical protein